MELYVSGTVAQLNIIYFRIDEICGFHNGEDLDIGLLDYDV
jgi:hypothetical protein